MRKTTILACSLSSVLLWNFSWPLSHVTNFRKSFGPPSLGLGTQAKLRFSCTSQQDSLLLLQKKVLAAKICVCSHTLIYHRLDAPSLGLSDGFAWCAGHSSDRDRLARAASVGKSRCSGSGVLLALRKLSLRDAPLVLICNGDFVANIDNSPDSSHHTLSANYCNLVMRSTQYASKSS